MLFSGPGEKGSNVSQREGKKGSVFEGGGKKTLLLRRGTRVAYANFGKSEGKSPAPEPPKKKARYATTTFQRKDTLSLPGGKRGEESGTRTPGERGENSLDRGKKKKRRVFERWSGKKPPGWAGGGNKAAIVRGEAQFH